MKYATRINSFLRTGLTVREALNEIGKIDGVGYVDLNYPEHFSGLSVQEMAESLEKNRLKVSAVNMRFRDKYIDGVFTNKDEKIRRDAVQLFRQAADVCEALRGEQIILWLSYDGYDYPFQMDYPAAWAWIVQCVKDVCSATDLPVSIEYKPYEERVHAIPDSYGTTLALISEVGAENLGMTLDFCHMLMKKENPAFAASLLLQKKKLFTVHVNDGEGSTDDGLMVGSVNLWRMLELYYYLKKYDYQGIIYFDTFPKREEAAQECRINIAMCRKMEEMVDKLGIERISGVISRQSAAAAMNMLMELL
ncbi:MAG: sugar phosphate isomerase/epimerase family protein [Christensenellales bacterium]|jgi:xylose isomerase